MKTITELTNKELINKIRVYQDKELKTVYIDELERRLKNANALIVKLKIQEDQKGYKCKCRNCNAIYQIQETGGNNTDIIYCPNCGDDTLGGDIK
jgi:Zn finger protein HypA/HybF involved in hydrogenase expression